MEKILFVISLLGLATLLGYMEHLRIEKVKRVRKEREIKRNIRLQEKRDNFLAYQRLIETYKRDCAECFEYDYKQYLDCYPNDYEGKKKYKHNFDLNKPCKLIGEQDNTTYQEAYENIGEKPIRNLRVALQDFTAGEVQNLFSF